MSGTLRINEIFHSIQGESTRAGRPCVFVRLAGCHLRCHYCDTEYAFREGQTRGIDDIIEEVVGYGCAFVEITGGEPLLQERVHDLMTRLCDMGKTVAIETSGACDIGACDPRVIRIVDIKTPGSGEHERTDWSNIARLTGRDEVKFVITSREDYEFAKGVIEEHGLSRRVAAVLLSPVFEQPAGLEILGAQGLPMRTLAEWMLEDGLDATLQTQLHKFIWDPQTRGV
jgi:7-carboxy-7-deazaguanine synthase